MLHLPAPLTLSLSTPPPRAGMHVIRPTLRSSHPTMILERPSYLDGTLAGDAGFDPLGLCIKLLPSEGSSDLDPAGLSDYRLRSKVMWMREAEVKHSRLAMLAAAGWPLAELWHGPFSSITGLPFGLEATQGRSLSLLNGHLGDVAPFLVAATAAMVAIEVSTLDQVYGLTSTGKTMSSDGQTIVMKSYVPGDCGFDPFSLYDSLGTQIPVMAQMQMDSDPEVRFRWVQFHRKEMETAELRHGRAAMLAITGFAFQELVTGIPVVDQTPIFFTPFWDILAPGAVESLGLSLF
ncbi:hypothetical protein AB1Y20_004806 [Prymnesium parvum]|uniref:Chlorophyll a-b binding protein, chloroplastic n=1 Tax=Prymnesium parvum TaxID=97485 RepID=A0AB34IX77_PRYPA